MQGCGAAVLVIELPHGQQQSERVLLAPRKYGTQPDRKCSHSNWSLDDFWATFPCVQPTGRVSQIFAETFWSHGRSKVPWISWFGGEEARHSGHYEFHCWAFCREASHRKVFVKVPSLPLAREIIFLQSLPTVNEHTWGSEQAPI